MAVRLEWSNRARRDLLEIYVKIGLDNPGAAERLYERIEKRAAMLREEPRLGPRRDDIRAQLRMLVENPYLIFCELTPDAENAPVERVEILRVLDGRRDLLRLALNGRASFSAYCDDWKRQWSVVSLATELQAQVIARRLLEG